MALYKHSATGGGGALRKLLQRKGLRGTVGAFSEADQRAVEKEFARRLTQSSSSNIPEGYFGIPKDIDRQRRLSNPIPGLWFLRVPKKVLDMAMRREGLEPGVVMAPKKGDALEFLGSSRLRSMFDARGVDMNTKNWTAQQRRTLENIVKDHELNETRVRPERAMKKFRHVSPEVILREHNRVVGLGDDMKPVGDVLRAMRVTGDEKLPFYKKPGLVIKAIQGDSKAHHRLENARAREDTVIKKVRPDWEYGRGPALSEDEISGITNELARRDRNRQIRWGVGWASAPVGYAGYKGYKAMKKKKKEQAPMVGPAPYEKKAAAPTMTTPQTVDGWAGQAADAFLTGAAPSVNHGVAKVALEHHLSDTQTARVCERANHVVFARRCTKTAEPGRMLAFDVARPETVQALIAEQATAEQKHAHVSDYDYYLPPPQETSPYIDLDVLWGEWLADPEPEKTAAVQQATQAAGTQEAAHRLESAQSVLEGTLAAHTTDAAVNEQAFYEEVRARLMEGRSLDEVYRDLILETPEPGQPGPGEGTVRSMMTRVMKRLRAENLVDPNQDLPRDQASASDVRAAGVENKVASLFNRALRATVMAEVTKQAIWDLEQKRAGLRLPSMPSLNRAPKPSMASRPTTKPQPVKIPKAVSTP